MKRITVFTGRNLSLPAALPFIGNTQGETLGHCVWPEAEVHPMDQQAVIESTIRSFLADNTNTQLVILTNSPYILTSLNVLLEAGQAYDKCPNHHDQISKVIGRDIAIAPGTLKAFSLVAGALTDIIDPDGGLISASEVDKASEIIGNKFDALLDILDENYYSHQS